MTSNGSPDPSQLCHKKNLIHAFLDILIIGIAAFPLLIFKVVATPFHRGFYCDDESIQYPLKSSTVTSPMLYITGFALNFLAFFVVEYIIFRKSDSQNLPSDTEDERKTKPKRIYVYFYRVYCVLLPFMFGAVISHLTTDIAKYSIGRLRPHFIDACKPDVTKYNCSHGYITADVCTGKESEIREARLSFPSGHSSFSMYTMTFLIFYLQARMTWKVVSLVRPLLQVVCFVLAYFTCLSRISDYKHHWSDVLGGAIIGIASAIWAAFKVSDLFTGKRTKETINRSPNPPHEEPVYTVEKTSYSHVSPELRQKSREAGEPHYYSHQPSSTASSTHLFNINADDVYESTKTHSHITTNI